MDGFRGGRANNGERFRFEELRQAGSNFEQRFHVLGDQKRLQKSERGVAETARNETGMLATGKGREREREREGEDLLVWIRERKRESCCSTECDIAGGRGNWRLR